MAPADDVLTALGFATLAPAPSLSLSLYQFDAATDMTVGGALFTGPPTLGPTFFVPLNGPGGYLYFFTFEPGGVTLTAGQTYAALLQNTGGAGGGILSIDDRLDTYAGGTLVDGNGGGAFFDFSKFFGRPIDAGFSARFGPAPAAVPEPSQAAALGLGALGVLGLLVRARRRRTAA